MEVVLTYALEHAPELAGIIIFSIVLWQAFRGVRTVQEHGTKIEELHKDHISAENSRQRIYGKIDAVKDDLHKVETRLTRIEAKLDK